MKVQTDGLDASKWTTSDDPRVTRFGKLMRKTSIDELPQIINVLKGDMSLVGPRPERPFYVDKFKEEIPRYMVKHQVRPGMTGWAQVNGYRGDTSIEKRIECDLYYIENWSLIFDFKIMFRTVFEGFVNKNAY
jgi:lipopolysaccharide/colanic/teichoic acid biosynthesis glycosyltransferase